MATTYADWSSDLVDQITSPSDPVWEENPVDLETFVRSEKHLGLPPLSRNQLKDLLAIFGEDPKKVFAGGSPVNVGVLLWGKGGGKDYCAAIGQNYANHILHCMRSPHVFFKLADRQFLDLLNTAPSEKNAVTVYYEFFKQMLLNWPWMRQKYSFYDERKRLMDISGNKKGLTPLVFAGHELEFKLKKVRTLTRGSNADVSEGLAPIYWCMDEASAFRDHTETINAEKLYKTLRTSAKTRYGLNWKGMIISYPREKRDFTVRMYDMAIRKGADDANATMYGSKLATWEARQDDAFSAETFDFEGIKGIPVTFKEEFDDNPEMAKMMLACIPPEVEAAFFAYPDRVLECVNPNRMPLFLTEDIEIVHQLKEGSKYYTGKKISVFNDKSAAAKKIPRVLHVDAGLTKDHATLVMAHGEPIEIKVKDDEGKITPTYRYKVVVDVVLRWRPDKKKKLQVSLNNIETIIFQIAEVYNIVKISYDQWNSQSSLEMLQSRNIQAEMHTIRDPDYYELRSMMYQGAVDLLPQVYEADGKFYENKDAALLYHELLTLKNMNGRVDHPKDSCFTGDTKIALTDGRKVSIKDLVIEQSWGKKNFVYSIDLKSKKIVAKPVKKVWCTGFKKIVKVVLDNDKEIKCTPNHKFMLRNGEYRQAKDLFLEDSLMPLYRRKTSGRFKGYECLYDPFDGNYKPTHHVFCGKIPKGYVIHHANYKKRNNNPTNLQVITREKHTWIHNQHSSPEEIEKKRNSLVKYHKESKSSLSYVQRARRTSNTNSGLNLDDKQFLVSKLVKVLNKFRKNKFGKNHPFSELRKWSDERRRRSSEIMKLKHKNYPEYSKKVKAALAKGYENNKWWIKQTISISQQNRKKAKLLNHKVMYVEDFGYDYVYDLEVDETHNFALVAGVFVHNSKDSADGLAGVNRLLNNPKEAVAVRRPMPKSTLGVGFTRATGMPFSPSQAGITQAIPDGFGIPKSPTPMTGQMTPSYMSMARSTATKSNIIPEAVVKGYATGMPAPMLAGSGKTPTATTKSMSTMMNRARMDVPAIHFK